MTIQFQGNLVITGQILCETGLHIGGVSEGIEIGGLENIVIRDPKTGLPFIPGSSLKGKMRSLLELSDKDATRNIIENEGKPCKCGKCAPCKIFGTPALDPKEKMEGRQLVSSQPYNVVKYISYVPNIQLEGIEYEEIHRDAY